MVAAVGLLTACDPSKDDVSMPGNSSLTGDQLASGFTVVQYADEEYTTEAADGNYFKFTTSPSRVVTIYQKDDEGNQNILASGKPNGTFKIVPKRGNPTEQTYYVETRDFNGNIITGQKTATVYVPSELSAEMRLLASDAYGSKTWYWDTESEAGGRVWGNMGAEGPGAGDKDGRDISGFIWWGVEDAADLEGQLGHSVTGQAIGEEDNAATMVISDDGSVKCYDKGGNQIRSGKVEVRNYDPSNIWMVGTLHTTEGATLFPFEINAGGKYVTDFEIHKLTTDKLVLVYPDGGSWGGWQEATFWCFKSNSDGDGMLTNYDGKSWTWDTESEAGGRVWGNMGAEGPGAGDKDGRDISGFIWWGVEDAADLVGQLGHSVTGEATGEEDNAAYMTFGGGNVKCFDAAGKEIRSGKYEIQDYDPKNIWKVGTLHTTEGATLFPFEINAGGKYVTDFEIHKLTSDKFVLVYPDGGSWGGWQEATYWCFKKK